MVLLAATSDLHFRERGVFTPPPGFDDLATRADVLIVAGDLTESGKIPEVEAAAEWLGSLGLPVVAVPGNHDRRGLRPRAFRAVLEHAGVSLLEGQTTIVVGRDGSRIGLAGVTGAGGGFAPITNDAIHDRVRRAVLVRARREAERLDRALDSLDTPVRVAITHFAPVACTLGSEPHAKWWMLGSSELGRVIDRQRVDLVVHGHAHLGSCRGVMPGGAPVVNVALPVNGDVVLLQPPFANRERDLVTAGWQERM